MIGARPSNKSANSWQDAGARTRPTAAAKARRLAATPRVGGGRVPVLLKLLSPARRPVQVTQDLESFWNTAYHEVRKELKGRYPRHYWPEDPRQAEPTRRVKPR